MDRPGVRFRHVRQVAWPVVITVLASYLVSLIIAPGDLLPGVSQWIAGHQFAIILFGNVLLLFACLAMDVMEGRADSAREAQLKVEQAKWAAKRTEH